MSTRLRLEKQLLRRIPELKNVLIRSDRKYKIYVSDLSGETSEDLIAKVASIAESHTSAGFGYSVHSYKDLPPEDYIEPDLAIDVRAIAVYGDSTRDGVIQGLIKLFPEIDKLEISEGLPPGSISFFVSYDSMANESRLNERVKSAAAELVSPALVHVRKYTEFGNPRNHVDAYWRGRLKPVAKGDLIANADKLQKEKFLNTANSVAQDPDKQKLPFALIGNRIFCIPGSPKSVPVTSLIPFYDQIFIQLPPADHDSTGDDYIREHTGLGLEDFLYLARTQRVIPVFKFSYSHYPDDLTHPIVSDFIPHIGPRDLDLLTLSSVAKWNVHQSASRSAGEDLYSLVQRLDQLRTGGRSDLSLFQLKSSIDFLIDMPDQVVPYFFDRGHLATSLFTPIPFYLEFTKNLMLNSMPGISHEEAKARHTFFSINLHSSALAIGIADALGATVCDGTAHAAAVTRVVADLMQGPKNVSILPAPNAELMNRFLKGVDVAYSDSIDLQAYEKIFDATEVRRMRKDLATLFTADQPEAVMVESVRELVGRYNAEIRSFARGDKYHLGESVFDVAAQKLVSESGMSNGWAAVVNAGIGIISTNAKALGEDIYSTRLGDFANTLRAAIAFKSPKSIQLHHLKRKIEKSKA